MAGMTKSALSVARQALEAGGLRCLPSAAASHATTTRHPSCLRFLFCASSRAPTTAASFRLQGRGAEAEVTVVEASPRLLARAVPTEISSVIAERHVAEGVTIFTGAEVACASADDITLEDRTRLDFDQVVVGVGSLPEIRLAKAAP